VHKGIIRIKSTMNVMRQLSVLIWNDDKFPTLPDDAQIVFFHLLTTTHTTTFGLFKGGVGTLAEEKRWKPERYREALRILISQKMAKYDRDALLLYIPRALRYNPPANPNIIKSWSEIFNGLPTSPLKKEFYDDLKTIIDSRNKEALTEAFLTHFGNGVNLSADDRPPVESEQTQDQDASRSGRESVRIAPAVEGLAEEGGGEW